MTTVPAHILKQRGVPITLLDGRDVTLVYTFSSLMRLEDDFGSIGAALNEVKQGESGAAFGSIARILAAGLEHEHDEQGARLDDVTVLRGLLDSTQLGDYSEKLGEAFEKAFPAAEEGEHADPQTAPDSPGTGGSTPVSSSSDVVTTSSGA